MPKICRVDLNSLLEFHGMANYLELMALGNIDSTYASIIIGWEMLKLGIPFEMLSDVALEGFIADLKLAGKLNQANILWGSNVSGIERPAKPTNISISNDIISWDGETTDEFRIYVESTLITTITGNNISLSTLKGITGDLSGLHVQICKIVTDVNNDIIVGWWGNIQIP